jgi:hypothetical protein
MNLKLTRRRYSFKYNSRRKKERKRKGGRKGGEEEKRTQTFHRFICHFYVKKEKRKEKQNTATVYSVMSCARFKIHFSTLIVLHHYKIPALKEDALSSNKFVLTNSIVGKLLLHPDNKCEGVSSRLEKRGSVNNSELAKIDARYRRVNMRRSAVYLAS